MRFLLLLSFLSLYGFLFGQSKKMIIRHSDSSFYDKEFLSGVKGCKLVDLTKSGDVLHFRFWTNRQAVDIWTLDNKTYNGQICCYSYGQSLISEKNNVP